MTMPCRCSGRRRTKSRNWKGKLGRVKFEGARRPEKVEGQSSQNLFAGETGDRRGSEAQEELNRTAYRCRCFAKIAEQLNKEAARAAMTDVIKANAALKTLTSDLKALLDGVTKQVDIVDGLPKAPLAA